MGGRTLSPRGSRFCEVSHTDVNWLKPTRHPVVTRYAGPDALLLIEWSAPWRLTLLFLISGAALGFMSVRRSPGAVLRQRTAYLLPPLFVAVIVVIPPQAYLRAVELFGYSHGYLAFWREFLAFDHRLCAGADCSVLPDLQHMWFVAYLWIYTVILAAILAVVPRVLPWLRARIAPVLTGWRDPEAARAIEAVAREQGAPVIQMSPDALGARAVGLRGAHQRQNAAVALGVLQALDAGGVTVGPAAIDAALATTDWAGRPGSPTPLRRT